MSFVRGVYPRQVPSPAKLPLWAPTANGLPRSCIRGILAATRVLIVELPTDVQASIAPGRQEDILIGNLERRNMFSLQTYMTWHGVVASSFRGYAGALVIGLLAACTGSPAHLDATWKMVPITDVRMVVADWEGTLKKNGALLSEGPARLMIRANHTYLFAAQTADDMAIGTGIVAMVDGRLIEDTDRRAVSFTLYDHKGKVVLVVDGTKNQTQDRYHGEFMRIE